MAEASSAGSSRRPAATAKERRAYLVSQGLKKNAPLISIKLILAEIGLGKYFKYFKEAGLDVIENYKRKDDNEVDDIIERVEHHNQVIFPRIHRTLLWKALRYRWFGDPKQVKSFVHSREVPKLTLPKKDHRIRDANVDFKYLDSDRQRMVLRRSHSDEQEGTRVVQFELYYREPEIFYEVLGMQRTVVEWQMSDPRKMIREDPREEVFLMQIRDLEKRLARIMDHIKQVEKSRYFFYLVVIAIRVVCLVMSLLCVIVSLDKARKQDSRLFLYYFFASYQFDASVPYFLASIVAHAVSTRDTNGKLWLSRYSKMHQACRILQADMISFRLDSDSRRLDKIGSLDDFEVSHEKKKKLEIIETVPKRNQSSFDGWFNNLITQGLEDSADIRTSMISSKNVLPDDPRLPRISADQLVDRRANLKDERVPPISMHSRTVNQTQAIESHDKFFSLKIQKWSEDKLKTQEKRLAWFAEHGENQREQEDDLEDSEDEGEDEDEGDEDEGDEDGDELEDSEEEEEEVDGQAKLSTEPITNEITATQNKDSSKPEILPK